MILDAADTRRDKAILPGDAAEIRPHARLNIAMDEFLPIFGAKNNVDKKRRISIGHGCHHCTMAVIGNPIFRTPSSVATRRTGRPHRFRGLKARGYFHPAATRPVGACPHSLKQVDRTIENGNGSREMAAHSFQIKPFLTKIDFLKFSLKRGLF
jgi:hypothetical protein